MFVPFPASLGGEGVGAHDVHGERALHAQVLVRLRVFRGQETRCADLHLPEL